jgi:SAM-dependent methyltransferase
MRSYTSTRLGTLARISEARNLYRSHVHGISGSVEKMLEEARTTDARIAQLRQAPTTGQKILEIGPGQHLVQLAHFGTKNDVVGIDLDVILKSLSPIGCVRMVRTNGWVRTCKTIVRKLTGIDSKIRADLLSRLNTGSMPPVRVLQMDAARMTFPDNHFDIVVSRAVFEHLPDPGAVLSEVARVLKPGGVMFIALHLFTSDSGSHDTRIFVGQREDLPYWAHLRPQCQHLVKSNSYLNKLRLKDWKRLFHDRLPGSFVNATQDAGDVDRSQLLSLRTEKELKEYSDEELLTVTLEATWQKPVLSSKELTGKSAGARSEYVEMPAGQPLPSLQTQGANGQS